MRPLNAPGPWTATRDTDTRGNPTWRIDSKDVSLIAELTYRSYPRREAGEPEARLIAGAPTMYDALLAERRWWEDEHANATGDGVTCAARRIEAITEALKKAGLE